MPVDEIPKPQKRSYYNPYTLPDVIYVSWKNSISTLTTPLHYPKVIVLTYDAPKTDHTMMREGNQCENVKNDTLLDSTIK